MYVCMCVCASERCISRSLLSLHASFAQSLSPDIACACLSRRRKDGRKKKRRKKKRGKKEKKKKPDTSLRRAVAFRFPGRNQSPLNRGGAEIRAPPRAVASIPPRLQAPQPMPCPASCFFDCLFFVLQLIFSPLSLSPAGWRQNSVSLVAKPRLDPIKEKTLALFAHASLQREMSGLARPNFLEARHVVLATAGQREIEHRLNMNGNSERVLSSGQLCELDCYTREIL